MNALSSITILPVTKKERKSFVEKAKQEILSGIYNPLEIDIYLKGIEELIKEIRKDEEIKEAIFNEAEKYSEKDIDLQSAIISKTSRKTYDYSCCLDSTYNDLKLKESNLKAEIKEREGFLKVIKEPIFIDSTGEQINPPSYKTTDILSINLK